MKSVAVAVPVPFLDLLSYAVPDAVPVPPVGARVRVPVGTRIMTGIVVEHAVPAGDVELKPLAEILDDEPFLPPAVVDLCRWVAEYYVAGIGDTLTVAMPPGAKGKSARASSFRTRRVASITAHGASYVVSGFSRTGAGADGEDSASDHERPAKAGPYVLTPKQRAALEVLAGVTAPLPLSELRERGVSAEVLGRLAARGLVSLQSETEDRDPFARAAMTAAAPAEGRALTAEQTRALEQLTALAETGEFRVALLHGVTGSGKTEVYLRLAEVVRRAGRQTLLLVPEIALTPSVAGLVRAAFGRRVAIQHSALSDGERHDQWQRIRRGEVDVVVGTRSAVFAPLAKLGLIIVDEEHDSSYKQEETPRYHGRDVAIVRASRDTALVVLGSATPSMETYQNCETGKYERAVLARRVLDRPLATVRLVNMREEYAAEGPDVVISRALTAAIDERLHRGEQVLVLLNRRGYATAVICRQCGDTFECPNCSISLTVHSARPGGSAARTLAGGSASRNPPRE